MRHAIKVLGAFALLAITSCGGQKKDAESAREVAQQIERTMPADLLVMAVLSEPNRQLNDLGAFVNVVKPGLGMMVSAPMVLRGLSTSFGGASMDAVNLDKPVMILVFDPQKVGEESMVLVAQSDTTAELQKEFTSKEGFGAEVTGDWIVAGKSDLVAQSMRFIGTVTSKPFSKNIKITSFSDAIRTNYQQQMDGALQQMTQGMGSQDAAASQGVEQMVAGLLSAYQDTTTVSLEVDATGEKLEVFLEMVANDGTQLKKFLAVQEPSDYADLNRLQSGNTSIVGAGHLTMGPYSETMMSIGLMFMRAQNPNAGEEYKAAATKWFNSMSGSGAIAMNLAPIRMTAAYQVTDEAAADSALQEFLTQSKTNNGKVNISVKPNAFAHKGASVHTQVTKPNKKNMTSIEYEAHIMTLGKSAESAFAVHDGYLYMTTSTNSQKSIKLLLDGSEKGAFGEQVQAAATDSRQRNESAFGFINPTGLMAMIATQSGGKATPAKTELGVTIGLKFTDDAGSVRISLPAKMVADLANQ